MGRKFVWAVAIIFALGIFLSTAKDVLAKEYKIGYVDLARVVDEYKKTKDSEKILDEKGKAKLDERKKLIDELRKLTDEQALLSEKAKADKQKVIDDKKRNLLEFDRKAQEDFMKERNDKFGEILKDVEKVISDYSKQEGYDFVLNGRMLLYGVEQLDLTNEVLKRLNK